MPTIEDLQAVLSAREIHAGDVETVRTRLAAPSRGHRTALAIGVSVAAVLALALGATVYAATDDRGRGPSTPAAGSLAPPAGPMQVRATFAVVSGYSVLSDGSWFNDYPEHDGWTFLEGAAIAATDSPATGSYVRVTGTQPQKLQGDGAPVTINGQPGVFTPGSPEQDVDRTATDRWAVAASDGDYQPRLRWQEPDGSWSYLSGTFGFEPALWDYDNQIARTEMLRLASAVTLGAPRPLTRPFRPAPLPADLWADDTIDGPGHPCVTYADAAQQLTGEAPEPLSVLTVCRLLSPGVDGFVTDRLQGASVTSRELGDGTTLVVGRWGDTVSEQTAAQILAGTDVTPSFNDQATWLSIDG